MLNYREKSEEFNRQNRLSIVYCDKLDEFEDELSKIEDSIPGTDFNVRKGFFILRQQVRGGDSVHVMPVYVETFREPDTLKIRQRILNLDSVPNVNQMLFLRDPKRTREVRTLMISRQTSVSGCFEDSLTLLRDFMYMVNNPGRLGSYILDFDKFMPEKTLSKISNAMLTDRRRLAQDMGLRTDALINVSKISETLYFPSFLFKHTEHWKTLREQRVLKGRARSDSIVPFFPGEYEVTTWQQPCSVKKVQLVPTASLLTLVSGEPKTVEVRVPRSFEAIKGKGKRLQQLIRSGREFRFVDFESQRKTVGDKLDIIS